MQQQPRPRPPVGVIFDCDMGNSVDDAIALSVLYGLDGKDECRVVSISTSKPNLKSAAMCEVIGRFYSGAVSGAFVPISATACRPESPRRDCACSENTQVPTHGRPRPAWDFVRAPSSTPRSRRRHCLHETMSRPAHNCAAPSRTTRRKRPTRQRVPGKQSWRRAERS